MESQFPSGWWSFALENYRPSDSTYELFLYESLPPLNENLFRGEFRWLAADDDPPGADDEEDEAPFEDEESDEDVSEVLLLDRLSAAVEQVGLRLPEPFVRFMGDRELQDEVPSCTDCHWDLSDVPVPSAVVPGAVTIRFLRDQQDCLFWYLHLQPGGQAEVLCSPIHFDEPEQEATPEEVRDNTWACAPHFEHFVYRFWMENVLFDLLTADSPPSFTPAQRAYLTHYEKLPRA
jgi:hypothetical protein